MLIVTVLYKIPEIMFSIVSPHQKLHGARLLLPEAKYLSCIKSF